MFKKDQIYSRRELHEQYGGSRQNGISPSSSEDLIFLFTGKTGENYGYKDYWDEDIFFYTGEGSKGDMEFKRGNKAILNHKEDQKKLYLFEGDGKGSCIFISEMEFVSFEFFETIDVEGNYRSAIKFALKQIENNEEVSSIVSEPKQEYSKPKITERNGLITSRVGQGWYRLKVLEKWNFKCSVLNIETSPILIASHIKPWRLSSDEERLDPNNGILLSPNLDALFDKNIISFDNQGKIILTNKVSSEVYNSLGINEEMKLSKINESMLKYLEYHQNITKNE
ncbi:HNH endonuclease [Empedobacter brevis]|uniref:HNH endonuclease n=1 Tax=Empedobacter brevis TaxID=247 RepID=UPI0028B001C7|nr:HNH endonuclease signature motif containing protein [Empedobacter brevis]